MRLTRAGRVCCARAGAGAGGHGGWSAFEEAVHQRDAELRTNVTAQAAIDQAIADGLREVRKLDAMVRISLKGETLVTTVWQKVRQIKWGRRTVAEKPAPAPAPAAAEPTRDIQRSGSIGSQKLNPRNSSVTASATETRRTEMGTGARTGRPMLGKNPRAA